MAQKQWPEFRKKGLLLQKSTPGGSKIRFGDEKIRGYLYTYTPRISSHGGFCGVLGLKKTTLLGNAEF